MKKTTVQIVNAFYLAKKYLSTINDPVGSSIFEHGQRVYLKLSKSLSNQEDCDILSAALLHDVLEDSSCSETEIVERVNTSVLSLVKELTITFENKSITQAVNILRYISFDAYLVKLADIIDNTQKTHFYVAVNGSSWYHDFYFPLLKEYERNSQFQLKKMRTHKYRHLDLATDLYDETLRLRTSLKRLVTAWEQLNNPLST